VRSSKVSENGQKILADQCAAVLRQGIDLIEQLPDAVFTRREESERSSVGAHFRHNLDFAANFFVGLETGKLDYNRRERDLRIETNRAFAVRSLRQTVVKLENLPPEVFAKKILVRSETVRNLWCESTATREMEFLQSHTIHHYALIHTKLAAFGFPVPPGFGVAPSTLEFWKSRAA
jgi:hypothetical protein